MEDYDDDENNINIYEDEIEEEDELREHYDGSIGNTSKKYIHKIRNLKFSRDIKDWVENKILNLKKRIHKCNDNEISAFIIIAHIILGKEYSLDDILKKIGTTKNKKNILKLVSGIGIENTPLSELEEIISMIVRSPVEFIRDIVKKFFIQINRETSEIDNIVRDIKHFTTIICDSAVIFSNYEPRSCACSFVFFYFYNFVNFFGCKLKRKSVVKKTIFKNLTFEDTKINISVFDTCLKKINEIFNYYINNAKKENIKRLIKDFTNSPEEIKIKNDKSTKREKREKREKRK